MQEEHIIIFKDDCFHCQFALPELRVVLRTDSGGLFEGINGPSWPAAVAEFHRQPRNTQLNQNRKRSGRSSKKTETHQMNFSHYNYQLLMEKAYT